MTKAEESCYPSPEFAIAKGVAATQGLSKREYFASQVLDHTAWNLLTSDGIPWEKRYKLIESGCQIAVEIADALIIALNK